MLSPGILAYLLLGLAANVDNWVVGTTYGLRRRRIGVWANGLIALCNGAATWVAVAGGERLRQGLSASAGDLLGGGVFFALAVLAMAELLRGRTLDSSPGPPAPIAPAEALILGLGLSVSNAVGGLGAGLAGFAPWTLAGVMVVFSWLPIGVGQWLGRRLGARIPPEWTHWTAAMVFLGAGLWEVLHSVRG